MIKKAIKKIAPKSLLNLRHLFFAWCGAVKYRHPSEELVVIGVTGTSGKSSTVYFLRQLLEAAGHTVGSLSTIDFYVAGEDKLNDQKMTMLGRAQTQKYLREMVDAGCTIALVETTSEGFVQHRHRFINYDMIVLTNLYPEHIESHGSFEKYKAAKLGIFSYIANSKRKQIGGQTWQKTAIVNGNSEYANEFLDHPFDTGVLFGLREKGFSGEYAIDTLPSSKDGITFTVKDHQFQVPIFGEYNALNITAAIVVARALRVSWEHLASAIMSLKGAPGRIECVQEAETQGFQAIVDYAFEPGAMKALYQVVDLLKPARVIHVFGSTGGGRDVKRRFTVGEFVGKHADMCIVTDEDPYDDDPRAIMDDVAKAVRKTGKKDEKDLFIIEDRRDAIAHAVSLAQKGDLILVTGKGSEQRMCVAGGKMIPWDDREEVRKAIQNKKIYAKDRTQKE